MNQRRILVTGATGFVGRHVLGPLSRVGFQVHAVGRRRPDHCVHLFHEVDLADRARILAVLQTVRPTHLLHLAWYVSHGRFWAAPENTDWIGLTLDLARMAADTGVRRFVGVGSCAEYDWSDGATTPRLESDRIAPSTLYGASKAETFDTVRQMLTRRSVAFAWARLFHLYGPGESPGRLVPSVVGALLAGRTADTGPGDCERDFMAVVDAGEALAALTNSGVAGAVNVASGTSVTVARVATLLGELTERADLVRIGALEDRPGEPKVMRADTTRLVREVGFSPRADLVGGLAACVDSLRGP